MPPVPGLGALPAQWFPVPYQEPGGLGCSPPKRAQLCLLRSSRVRGPGLGPCQALPPARAQESHTVLCRSPRLSFRACGPSPGAMSGVGTEELAPRRLWTPWESGRVGWGRQDSFSDHRRVSLGRATRPGAAAHHAVCRGRPWEPPPRHARLAHRPAQALAVLCGQCPSRPPPGLRSWLLSSADSFLSGLGSSLPLPEGQSRRGVSPGGRRSPWGVGGLALVPDRSPLAGRPQGCPARPGKGQPQLQGL